MKVTACHDLSCINTRSEWMTGATSNWIKSFKGFDQPAVQTTQLYGYYNALQTKTDGHLQNHAFLYWHFKSIPATEQLKNDFKIAVSISAGFIFYQFCQNCSPTLWCLSFSLFTSQLPPHNIDTMFGHIPTIHHVCLELRSL